LEKIESILAPAIVESFHALFGASISTNQLTFNDTPKNFTGDITLVVFPLLKFTKLNPEASGNAIGAWMKEHCEWVDDFNVVKGFLNLILSQRYWTGFFDAAFSTGDFGKPASKSEKVLVEYSSPNTNKPLHLGHVRNNVLGAAVSGLLKEAGYQLKTCNLVNDRGIHICKSMLAWKLSGKDDTPESTGMKGDKLVGHYYVAFEKQLQQEATPLIEAAMAKNWDAFTNTDTDKIALLVDKLAVAEDIGKQEELKDQIKTLVRNACPVMQQAREMLQAWEAGDDKVVALWKMMNGWVYDGMAVTYDALGVHFDKIYFESNTYLLGKDIVQEGLDKGAFFRKEDGSVWVDLTEDGLDEKLLLRSDGTSVYITQDLGTADLRYGDFGFDRCIYVVGNEQEYHFKVLQLVMKKLGRSYADGLHHFSYGMVDLPSGKMKSREGTVVDADDLIADMITTAKEKTEALGKMEGFSPKEAENLYRIIGLGALKFFLLRVDPRKRILFNPEESIDLQGYTGPFVQYTYARIRSILRRFEIEYGHLNEANIVSLEPIEKELLAKLNKYGNTIEEAASDLNPARLIDYIYELAKLYNKLYADLSIFNAGVETARQRVALSALTGKVIKDGFGILGIEVPERM
jgi:arginyl-tRNA synthetase